MNKSEYIEILLEYDKILHSKKMSAAVKRERLTLFEATLTRLGTLPKFRTGQKVGYFTVEATNLVDLSYGVGGGVLVSRVDHGYLVSHPIYNEGWVSEERLTEEATNG